MPKDLSQFQKWFYTIVRKKISQITWNNCSVLFLKHLNVNKKQHNMQSLHRKNTTDTVDPDRKPILYNCSCVWSPKHRKQFSALQWHLNPPTQKPSMSKLGVTRIFCSVFWWSSSEHGHSYLVINELSTCSGVAGLKRTECRDEK